MKNKKIKIDVLKLIFYVFVIITYLQFVNMLNIKKILFDNYIIFYCVFIVLLTCFSMYRCRMKVNKRNFFLWGAITITSICSIIINNGSFGSIIMEICTPIILFNFSNIKLNKTDYKIIYYVTVLLTFFTEYRVITAPREYLFNPNFYNPNLLSQLLVVLNIIFNMTAFKMNKSKVFKIIYNILCLIGIYYSGSRSGIIVLILYFILMYCIPRKILGSEKLKKGLLIGTIILGIIVPIIYVNMYKESYTVNFDFSDKAFFSGRQIIWEEIFKNLDNPKNIIFGLGSNFKFSRSFYHMYQTEQVNSVHNMFLTVIFNGGGALYLLIYGYIIIYMKDIIKEQNDSMANFGIYGIIVCFINGFFESMFVWLPLNILICMIVCILKSENVKNEVGEFYD